MLFNSTGFIFLFFPSVYLVARLLKGDWLLLWLVICSYVFYAFFGHPWFLWPMGFTTVLDYILGIQLGVRRSLVEKRCLLLVSLVCNLGLLGILKYGGLIRSTLAALRGNEFSPALFSLALPAGISFYTFQTVSYVIDIYRGQAVPERNLLKFAAYVSFFPHLVAGPLTRHDQLLPGLTNLRRNGITSDWENGVYLFAVGLIKKTLLADPLGQSVDKVLWNAHGLHFTGAWFAIFGFAFQIYFDFSAYTDMALGLGRLFGIQLPQNFDNPYQARSPSDFWGRWHITLSLWLRDYLFIPLGGSRGRWTRRLSNLMVTMLLGGLWHGAQWTFALWGLYHGIWLCIYHLFHNAWDRAPLAAQRTATFFIVSFGWIFFRSHSVHEAAAWARCALAFRLELGSPCVGGYFCAYLLAACFVTQLGPTASRYSFKNLRPSSQFGLGLLTIAALLMMNYSSPFLYFQF